MNPRQNKVHAKRAAGGTAMGVNIQTTSPENVEMAGAAGYDFVIIDCEHGVMSMDRTIEMLRAADATGVTPVVRVPDQAPGSIMRALDAGAMGVIIPGVATRAQAEAAVAAAKFRTREAAGARGACPSTRANWHLVQDWPSFVRWSNQETMVWILVESPEGVANIDEILQVPGIDAIVPGPFDLAQAMGRNGDMRDPEVVAALEKVVHGARRRNVETIAVLLASNDADLREETAFWRRMGATAFWVGGDRRMFTVALRQRMAQVQAGL